MRAVAVLLVMAYHAGLPLPNGFLGVDVFFVISGFLITGLLVRELVTTGTVDWARFVGRRIRRLLPAAILVLVVTALVAWVVVPGLRRREIGTDIAGAALYVVNWVFAHRAVDYLASDSIPSPVQHFWSLAVEEQFYVIWPLALIALALVLRRLGRMPTTGAVGALLAAIALPSLGYAVWLGAVDPARAYFVTTTRAWELGVGAALAVWCAGRQAPTRHTGLGSVAAGAPAGGGRVAAVVGWVGLAAVLAAACWLPAGAVTPGPWTLAPTLGAAAVLYAGWAGAPSGPVRLLGTAPMVWVGGLSYSLYLWHWPALVLGRWAFGGLGPVQRTGVVALAVVLAWLSHRFLESPIHHSRALAARTRPVLALGLALSLVGALAAVPLTQASSPFRTTPLAGPRPAIDTLGAATLTSPPSTDPRTYAVDDWGWLTPDPQLAGQDRPKADVDRCQVDRLAEEPVACEFGVPGGTTTVALVGDSKAMQWLPALERLAPQRGWRIVTYGKSACAFASGNAQSAGRPYPACDEWNRRVLARLRAAPPDLLLTSGYASTAWDGSRATSAALVAGLSDRWSQLRGSGVPVVVLGDSPVSPNDLDVCAARHPHQLSRCAFGRDAAVAGSGLPAQQRAATASGTPLIDLTPWICPVERCPVAIGNVAIHRAGDHLTATYVRTLAPVLGAALDRVARSGPAS
ncbi:peptidoglycan/LPS O-acetylase OafA/YrhL [Phycicoccus badiiscoriae]|uniref:Peptidoglycan/LPS O-acetylase OafA/YrhL n=1 Tax=Pedococcus badiiscoriae TaxID=642776 RepID=A0A852WEV0_9MICO|nr:peptidoglycan/LPS O-acetylase OafA/YrhL [Pedococcus badiiscoriae]